MQYGQNNAHQYELNMRSNSNFLMKSAPRRNVIPTVYGVRCIKRIANETPAAMAASDKSLAKPSFSPVTHPSCLHLSFQPAATQESDGLCGNRRYRCELRMMGIMVPETC